MSFLTLQQETPAPASLLPHGLRKVLHVISGEYYAGAERVQDLLALGLPEFGFEVGFVCIKPDRFAEFRQAQDAPLWNVPFRHPWHRRAARQIAGIADREGYDLLHSHTRRTCWAAMAAARLSGLPVVHTMHDVGLGDRSGLAARILNRYTAGVLSRADFLIGVSPAALAIADEHGLGAERCLIHNGVPGVGSLPDRPLPEEWTVGTVSLIRPCKGIEVLIRAVARLRQRNHPVRLKVVGRFHTARYEKQIRSLVDSLGVGDRIELAGFTNDVPAQLRQMDLFVLPSVGPEGLPMVVLEAMAHGVPIVGSDVAGIADVVRDGVDGRIFAAGDDRALAEAIDDFVRGDLDWQQMRRRVYDRQQAEFTAGRVAHRTAGVYATLLARSCGGRT